MFFQLIREMHKLLGQIDTWLLEANSFAQAKKFDPNVFLGQRLAPDQFPLVRQIQSACDSAKFAAARLTGATAPSHPDEEKTVDELRARVASVRAWLDGLSPSDFEGAATRVVTRPGWNGKVMSGADYFLEHAQPNFFFHLTHTYAILRHNGVDLGKRHYLGELSLRDPS
jgi:hypothetical protein